MMHTEGQARAAFAAEAAGARHFAATASARQVGETASAADSRTGRCYQLLARDEFNTWCLLDRHLRFEERQRQQQQQQQQQADGAPPLDVGVAWMREVLAWLEGMAQLPAAAAFGRCGWDKTCQGLAGRGATPAARIDALDPDACSRQQRGVHPDDRAAEDEFLRALWACVRAGDVQRAQEICRRSQQSWRAASLAPAGQSDRGATRRVWKTACRELAADPAAPSFERAVYAVLSADAGALQAFRSTGEDGIQGVLGSWYDKVWAWAKVWVDSHDDSAAQAGELPLHTSGEDMKQALDAFLHACSAATEEDCLAGTVAGTVESDGAGIAETWINDAVHFYRGVQELLIFTVPGLDQRAGQSLSLNRVWNSAPDGVFPTSLRWPLALNFSADRTSARLPTDIQQLGDDLSSQLTRTALHAGVLLAGSVGSQTDGSPGRVLASGELEPLGRDYIQLLAASIEDGASDDVSESLGLVAEYATWLPVLSQGDTLVDVLKDMPSSAWKVVLMNAALQPEVVAEVQYRVVQYIVGSSAVGDGDKLDALLWACSNAVDDGHDGLLMRMQGLRQVNGYLRKRTIEEGMDGLSGDPPYILLEVGKALCGAEMSDLFESMYETFPHTPEVYNDWLQAPGGRPPVAYLLEMADVSFASCQDDLREYRCWQVLLDGQHCVTEFGPSILQAVEVGAQQQHEHLVSYERTTKALYPLVSFEGRWMLDISTTAHGSGSGSDAQVQRLREMEHIRKSCVPHVCFQLMHFLQAFGDHHRCLDLIEIIAREDSPLFQDFEPSTLSKLLARVPEILVRLAAHEPPGASENSRHQTLCQLLLTS